MTEETTTPESSEEPTLEELYAQFDAPAEPKPQPPAPKVEANDAVLQEIQNLRRDFEAEKQARSHAAEESDLNSAVSAMAKASGIKGKNTLLKGYLLAKAGEDTRLQNAWNQRKSNPAAWEQVLGTLAKDVQKEFEVPDPQLEENQRAMAMSQKAASSKPPDPDSIEEKAKKMSDSEFGQLWGNLIGRV